MLNAFSAFRIFSFYDSFGGRASWGVLSKDRAPNKGRTPRTELPPRCFPGGFLTGNLGGQPPAPFAPSRLLGCAASQDPFLSL